MNILLVVVLGLVAVALAYLLYKRQQELRDARRDLERLRARFAPILDLDSEKVSLEAAISAIREEHARFVQQSAQERTDLSAQYTAAMSVFEQLRREVALLEENVEDLSFGIYKPHFDFQSSEQYKAALEQARHHQKEIIRAGMAAVCDTTWTISGSAREGERMAKQYTKLILRAFNAECDAAVANVTWNNVLKMEERIRKAFEALNKLGTVMSVRITEPFLRLKLDELRLTHEHELKRHEEREEQRRIREQIREEERVQRELAKALEDAAKEEARFEKALERARNEAAKATGAELDALSAKIASLEAELKKAHEQKERAMSMAQLTKSGYVYVISNIGSFGEQVYKVGMTRRLEPLERVAELGDASVPFPFDVHAMLYSDNAPELEKALHEHLGMSRVNLVNPRKEFFEADLSMIEAFAKSRGINVEFTLVAEARDYRESIAIRDQMRTASMSSETPFPADPFAPSAESQIADA